MPEVKRIYLDNAATTRLEPAAAMAMMPFLEESYGNPSSIHGPGRESRSVIDKARRKISDLIQASPAEIIFTSGGTEANNHALICSVRALGIKTVISSPLEHHAVLHTLEFLEKSGEIRLRLLECDQHGNLDFHQLRSWLDEDSRSLVSLMQANNEIGNLYELEELAAEVKERGGMFHSDTVQTVGKIRHNFSNWKADFMLASAHKFHGPKGVGFLAMASGSGIPPFLTGGSQERNMRGGTENLMGIAGMAAALEVAVESLEQNQLHIGRLKRLLIELLREGIPGVRFNGLSGQEGSIFNVLNVSLPPTPDSEMILANLDIRGIAASGGSACSSGSDIGSHVLHAIQSDPGRPSVRFSFSKYNTEEEIRQTAEVLCSLFPSGQPVS